MVSPNALGFGSNDSGAFSYEHSVALADQNEDSLRTAQLGTEEDPVGLALNHTSAVWGEAFGGNDIPLSPDQVLLGSIRGRHVRRYH